MVRYLVSVQQNSGLYIDPTNDMLYAIDSETDENYNPGGWRKGLRVVTLAMVRFFILLQSIIAREGVSQEWVESAAWVKA
ncbi:MAG: hypothetical protein Ct9H90mP25_6120 [Gammaproteobacteria bacterium]|nr:MAG: hypothetical protein Ct9H90mP25_6120 [Gammaproteobacteria bacterium]